MTDAFTCPACAAPRPLPSPTSGPADGHVVCPECGDRRPVRGGVLVLDDEPGAGEYPAEIVGRVAEIEQRHWWHASRNDVLGRLLARATRGATAGRAGSGRGEPAGRGRLVEFGCGTGFVLASFERAGWHVTGLDMHAEALAVARRRVSGPLLRTGRLDLPLAEPADVVAVIDVLEHNDEAPLLAACHRALRPGGLLLLSVPAQPWLWSLEDVMSGHRRRYTRATLLAAVEAAGFDMLRQVPFHLAVTPLAWRAARRPLPDPLPSPAEYFGAALREPSARGRAIAGAVLRTEAALGARVPLPFASHLAAVAVRR